MTMLSRLRAIFPEGLNGLIFDCDGVLIDSCAANVGYYNLLLRELGKPPMTPAQEAYTQMASAQQAVEHITTPDELAKIPEICQRFPYRQVSLPLLELEPGIRELLNDLRERGIRLAVHTNRGAGMWDVLDKFGMRDFFNPVMTVDTVPPKPAPDGVLHIMNDWGFAPGRIGFLGDSATDAGAAKQAGVPLLAFRNPHLEAALHVDSFSALQEALLGYFENSKN